LNSADKVLNRIEKAAQKEFLPKVGRNKGQILAEIVRKTTPKKVLEIESNAHLISIEIHADEAKRARTNIKEANIPATIDVIVGDAIAVIPKLKEKFDMVFIDAEKIEYLHYLRLIEDKLHKGSVVVADNEGISANQMKDYMNHVRSSGKYNSKYIPVDEDGLEVSVRL
jgi:predicted O-methyltransferase YrrM